MLTRDVRSVSDGIVSLREISRSDAEVLFEWRMATSSRTMFRRTEVVALDFHLSMIEQYLNSESPDRWFLVEADRRPVGTISLYNFTDGGHVCEWGRFVIAPELRNLGYGRRALKLLMGHAQKIGIKQLKCEVLAANTVAVNLYRDLGFAQTGLLEDGGRLFFAMIADLDAET